MNLFPVAGFTKFHTEIHSHTTVRAKLNRYCSNNDLLYAFALQRKYFWTLLISSNDTNKLRRIKTFQRIIWHIHIFSWSLLLVAFDSIFGRSANFQHEFGLLSVWANWVFFTYSWVFFRIDFLCLEGLYVVSLRDWTTNLGLFVKLILKAKSFLHIYRCYPLKCLLFQSVKQTCTILIQKKKAQLSIWKRARNIILTWNTYFMSSYLSSFAWVDKLTRHNWRSIL